ncbi:hypothetical protein ACFOZY_14265 [Chungangia koreensis]|uniref:SnoaL-like domain-containing protein n=1 Tax=Chungangia koreensis TaxID=752657 RepID=A0ABV8X8G2_9LACT
MKFKHFSILFVLSLILSACNTNTTTEPQDRLGEIYSAALDSIMEMDEGLNGEMEYIAIDMSNFDGIDEQNKKVIFSYFEEKYNVEVMDTTLDQLKEKGLFHTDTMSLDGVLLRIDKLVVLSNNTVPFEGSKFRSALGGVGVEGIVKYEENKWKAKEVKMMWIS